MTALVRLAHTGSPPAPHDLASAWPLEPSVVVGLIVAAWLYWRGARVVRLTEAGRQALPVRRLAAYAGGLTTVALALLTPLDALSAALFSAHMGQHLLLVLLAAPLLLLGRPVLVTSFAFGGGVRRRFHDVKQAVVPSQRGAPLWALVAITAHTVTFWFWHVPGPYRAALNSDVTHAVEHATMLAGGLALWWLVVDPRGRQSNLAGLLAVFVGVVQSGLLAGLISFTPSALYPWHAEPAAAWGLSALEDQRVAGGLMWFPGSLAYVIAGAVLVVRWLRLDERSASTDRVWSVADR